MPGLFLFVRLVLQLRRRTAICVGEQTGIGTFGRARRATMRKTLVLMVVIGLIAAAFTAAPAQAGKKKKKAPKPRVVESIYDAPAIGHPDVVVGCSGSTGCASFAPGPGERYVRFEVI